MIRETIYRTLDRISQIKDKSERMKALREVCAEKTPIALLIQYCYHPDVEFDLPEGPLPDTIYTPSTHDEYGQLYREVKKLRHFFKNSPVSRARKEMNFVDVCEVVTAKDAELLMAVKDKKLPWRKLGQNFCYKALPELFPEGVLPANMRDEEEDA